MKYGQLGAYKYQISVWLCRFREMGVYLSWDFIPSIHSSLFRSIYLQVCVQFLLLMNAIFIKIKYT